MITIPLKREPPWPRIAVCKVCRRIQTMREDGTCKDCAENKIELSSDS